jgi:TonB-dependent starch-binding outer membrane protein SusC
MNFKLVKMQRHLQKKKLNSFSVIKSLSLLLLSFVITVCAYAQTKPITGKVTDESGVALSGITVKIKNSNQGVTTNAAGVYAIDAAEGAILVISSISFETSEVTVGKKSEYNVSLKSSAGSLGEVVVVGYGTQKKSTLTGSVGSVSGKTLNDLPVASLNQALQGRVAGVSVVNNGSPGSEPLVIIRGISSIRGNLQPLYVIDGFPTGSINTFDSKDIESVEVLKDASAAAIYGSRGTNGVILITTKKGKRNGRLQVNLDSYLGVQSPQKKISLLNTEQYKQFATSLLGAGNLPPRLIDSNFNKPIYPGSNQTFAQTNTDWQDAYFVNNAIITQHNISVAGGNEVSKFYSSAGYFNQDGIATGVGYKRGNFRINSEHNICKVFTFGQNLYTAFADQRYDATAGNRSPLTNVIRSAPYLPVYNPNTKGGFFGATSSFDGSDPTNPVEPAVLEQANIKQVKIFGNAFVEVNFTKWLKFRSLFGIDYSNNLNDRYRPIYNDGGSTYDFRTARILKDREIYTTKLFTEQLSFNKAFGEHQISAVAVFETQGQNRVGESLSGEQDNNFIRTLFGATNPGSFSTFSENFIQSYIGRVTYDYSDKYLFNASIRRDGLSIWAPGNKYQNFPAVSVGWRVDKESFMKNVKQISELKLRAGYGLTGLDGVNSLGNYPWQVGVALNQSAYPFEGGPSLGFGSFFSNLPNRDLKWETTKQLNIGLDLGLFKNKITLVAEYYKRQSDNLIIPRTTPFAFGFEGGGTNANIASLRNTGYDFQAAYHKTKGDFKFDITSLISTTTNKVLALDLATTNSPGGGDPDISTGAQITATTVGESIQYFYGWVTDGLFQNANQVAGSAFQSSVTRAGDIKFKDINEDGVIDDKDRTKLGSFLPDFTYSLNLSGSYKNFDATIFFQGSQGNTVFNGQRVISEGMKRLFNASTAVLNAWTPTNTNTNVPRAVNSDPNQNSRVSDRWLEDGSYLRLKNVSIGYNLPESILRNLTKGSVSKFRLYVSSQNLLTFTQYKGWDPEVGTRNGALSIGIDYGQYPSARSFQVGVQVGF